MTLRKILEMLGNRPEVIQKLAESYPMKRAAQITVAFFHQMKASGQEKIDEQSKKIEIDAGSKTIKRIFERFQENLDKEMKDREKKGRGR